MQAYSVLLLYPDYLDAAQDGVETYHTFVQANNVKDAIAMAREDCIEDNSSEDGSSWIESPSELAVLLVIEGYHPDIKFEAIGEESACL